MSACSCANDWRVEALDLATGRRKTWLNPTSLNFDQLLNDVGGSTVTVPVRSVTAADVWPHTTSVAISRISGPGASPENPAGEYIGLVESTQASSEGSVQIGLKSIEQYLNYRLINADTSYTQISQTAIGATLVNLAASNGIPLVGGSETSTVLRDRNYLATDRKQILEALLQLTQVINGPDYELIHSFLQEGDSVSWSTRMNFVDYLGNTTPSSLNARLGISGYDVSVNGEDHANKVIGVGENPEMTYTKDNSAGSIYPLFEKSVAWSDVSVPATLQEHTEGEAANNAHPTAVPGVTVEGTELAAKINLGDTVDLDIDHGAIQYRGLARVVGKTWSSSDGEPTTASFSFTPLDDAATAILGATPSSPGCC